jgi:hypothetical protein
MVSNHLQHENPVSLAHFTIFLSIAAVRFQPFWVSVGSYIAPNRLHTPGFWSVPRSFRIFWPSPPRKVSRRQNGKSYAEAQFLKISGETPQCDIGRRGLLEEIRGLFEFFYMDGSRDLLIPVRLFTV